MDYVPPVLVLQDPDMRRIWIFLCALASLVPGGRAADKAAASSPVPKATPNRAPINLNAEQAAKLLQENRRVIVLDVRTPEEFAAGHIAGARNLNYYDPSFETRVAQLDKDTPYLVHCASGHRSSKVREWLKKREFRSVYHLDGGLTAWQKAGQPVVK